MPAIRVHNLSFTHSHQQLFHGCSFELNNGIHGVVGSNGSGKTTLLRLLAKQLVPDEGQLSITPKHASVVLCEQGVEILSTEVIEFSQAQTALARAVFARLQLEKIPLSRWSSLSPGEKKRWQLAAAISTSPEILLLDEPTNHIDHSLRQVLCDELAHFAGLCLIVSHDRMLLEQIPESIVRVHRGSIEVYPGSLSSAKQEWQLHDKHQIEQYARATQRVKALEQRLFQARQNHQAADNARSVRKRVKGPRDHDGRSAGSKFRAEKGEASAGQKVTLLRAEVERNKQALSNLCIDPEIGGSVWLKWTPFARPHLLHLQQDEIKAGDNVVLRNVNIQVSRTDRIRLAGPNGAGKTTLLLELLKQTSSDYPSRPTPNEASPLGKGGNAKVMFIPQELSFEEQKQLLKDVLAEPNEIRGRVLSLAASLGLPANQIINNQELSPGEAKKLQFALGLGRYSHALLLDEPTNHLDLPTIERLEKALRDYPGALVIVTHDDQFAQICTDTSWVIDKEKKQLCHGAI